jgi:hypothetical protein
LFVKAFFFTGVRTLARIINQNRIFKMTNNGVTLRREISRLFKKEAIESAVELLTENWEDSPQFQSLTAIQKEYADSFITFCLDYGYNYIGTPPHKWNKPDWDEILLDIFPRKLSAEKEVFEQISPVLSQFVLYHSSTGYFKNPEALAAYIKELDDDIVAASQDRNSWGLAKQMVMGRQMGGSRGSGCLLNLFAFSILSLVILFNVISFPFRLLSKGFRKIFS